ncbi:MAG TPA: S41 family peptidase [Candidatus Wallbacteria bacterium]|nr:S41 family peptidase [Candidatus Wallbacteria bacterium]
MMKNNNACGRYKKFLAVPAIICVAGLIFSSVPASGGTVDIGALDNLNVLRKVFNLIKSDHIKKDVTEKELMTGAINGMLESLNDPYSRYLEPNNFKDMQSDTSGEFEGVGIVISVKNKMLTVVSPIDDTPAKRAGIKSGDKILKIDGSDTDKMTLHDAVTKMKGKKDSSVTLTIWRNEFREPKNFTLTRDVIPLKTVVSKMVDDKIGYVRISQFTETTSSDLEKELLKLEGNGIEAIILDLRDNPGGLLTAAVDVSRKFIDKGVIVTVKSRDGKTLNLSSYYRSHPLYPMVVLINKGSASSSEIVSGALQDNRRAILIGNKTFGKGVIQTVIPMENDAGLILTTAWYFTPAGRSIHHKGIEPDINIEQGLLSDEEAAEIYDNYSKDEELKTSGQIPGTAEGTPMADRLKKYGVKLYDTQMVRAIELLNGIRLESSTLSDKGIEPKVIASKNISPKAENDSPAK